MFNIEELLRREQVVKDIYEKDKTDPELYLAIRSLARMILLWKKFVEDKRSADEISHRAASELYQMVANGELEVDKWTAYLLKYLLGTRREYRDDYNTEIIEVECSIEYEKIRRLFYAGSYSLTKGFEISEIKSFVMEMPEIIRETFEDNCKFTPDYFYYDNLYLTIICSISHDEFTVFGNLPEPLLPYTRFLYKVIKEKVKDYVIEYLGGSGYEGIYDNIVSYESFDVRLPNEDF